MSSTEDVIVKQRSEQLSMVFNKALDESLNSMNESDLDECFGNTKLQLGSNLQRLYMNMISKTESKIMTSFEQINELDKLEDTIRNSLHNKNNQATMITNDFNINSIDESLNEVVLETKEIEKKQLVISLQHLESEVKKSKELLNRLRTQIHNEIAAATEECQKMSIVAAQCANLKNSSIQ